MKLYKVQVVYTTVIAAANEVAAIREASNTVRLEDDNDPDEITADLIEHLSDLPGAWTASSRPWGLRDLPDQTIGEILDGTRYKYPLR